MTSARRTILTGVTATRCEYLRLSHIRPQTFIGVVFVPHHAKPGKSAPACANCASGRDLLWGRQEAD